MCACKKNDKYQVCSRCGGDDDWLPLDGDHGNDDHDVGGVVYSVCDLNMWR